ncbi:MAG: type I-E CRISPR-associated protein Cse2/CasB [Gammaproteobacteria bacterium]|nr:type I-E CRISPR-associated protein Cse2/CasB [Gammaproteobacteria bacterium]MDE0271055.1 type I-E CRISPR-associated protein Cse2/CasB [Gammaproteobacteria bacterium]
MTNREKHSGPAIAFQWWSELTAERAGRRRAALARMRRAATPIEVMFEPEALGLIQRLPRNPDRVAALAGILACVRSDDSRLVARAVGRDSLDNDQPPAIMSEARFRRILQTSPDGLMDAMRRLVAMTKGQVNVRDLSAAVLYWGERVKRDWMFQYYNVSLAAPDGQGAAPKSPTQSSESEQ